MPIIQVLPEAVSCRIAAGEVVQRPASVVKELLDNSIDAAAKTITVEALTGGKEMLQVTDDGSGMEPDDLKVCLQRHATSKIRTVEDLDAIASKGFRGEALAAISSVAIVEVTSRCGAFQQGYTLRCEGGGESPIVPCGCPVGTRIKVSRLFYNTPARQKFLKSPTVELGHITEQVIRAAITFPEIHFRLDHNLRTKFDLPRVGSRLERLSAIWGHEELAQMTAVEGGNNKVYVNGFVSLPPAARKSADHIYFFVNDRFVRDRQMQAALTRAYQSSLPQRQYPGAVLYIEVDPFEIDINVHPTKEEVRFGPGVDIFSAIYHTVSQGIAHGQPITMQSARTNQLPTSRSPTPEQCVSDDPTPPSSVPSSHSASEQCVPSSEKPPSAARSDASPSAPPTPRTKPASQPISSPDERLPSSPESRSTRSEKTAVAAALINGDSMLAHPQEQLIAKAQIHSSYIVAESKNQLLLVDQHAAHERIRFEQLKQTRQEKRSIVGQPLLFPVEFDVPVHHVELVEAAVPVLDNFGFKLEPFGPNTFAVHSIPSELPLDQVTPLIHEIVDDLRESDKSLGLLEIEEKALAKIACRTAVKAGEPLDLATMQSLLDQWQKIPHSQTCPHGRPPIWSISWAEVGKLFRRP